MSKQLHLFEGYGVELEYMIVSQKDLRALPIADQVLEKIAGLPCTEVDRGEVSWSNELVLHVLELKFNGPKPAIAPMAAALQNEINHVNGVLKQFDAMLLPTAMHPFFDPLTETKIWPHENTEIYHAYNRIFGCTGHGWSNLQSTHINLPFCGDEEFGRLHAAIRLVLPLLPALAASSPVVSGALTPFADNRLEFYRHNQKKIPSISGNVVPEAVFTPKDYHEQILGKIYRDISSHDPDGILQYEWLNSRGAIARFDRNAIEIRVLDIQESIGADLAMVALVSGLVQALVDERWMSFEKQTHFRETELGMWWQEAVRSPVSVLKSKEYLSAFGIDQEQMSMGLLWQKIAEKLIALDYVPNILSGPAHNLVFSGNLSERIRMRLGNSVGGDDAIRDVYRELAACLAENRQFVP